MEEIKIFNMDKYRIVNKVPKNYIVWNIGSHMGTDEYIPFAQPLENYRINPYTLLAVKLNKEDVKILRKVAGRGSTDIRSMDRRIKRCSKNDCNTETLQKAKEILLKIYE